MKKFAVLLMAGLLIPGIVFADAIDDAFPANADNALKAHTRAMIHTGVDQDQGLNMTRAMLENQFQNQHIIQAQEIVMQAARQGMPAEPVMNKAQEGMAKHVPPDRVVQAMEQVRNRYAQAHQLTAQLNLNAQARYQTGNTMAEAMAAGITMNAGNRIAQQLQTRTKALNQSEADQLAIQTAMATREMARLGVNADTSADVICQALQNQFQARDMIQLRQQFRDQAHRQDPQGLAQRLAHQFQQGQSMDHAFGQGNGGSGSGNAPSGDGMGNSDSGMGGSGSGNGSDGGGSGSGGGGNDSGSGGGAGSGGGGGSGSGGGGRG